MIEAMACGTPVIAFRHGSVPEVIDEGVTGFVVDDEEGAVRAIGRLGEIDRREVRACFERRFTARRMATEYVALYEKLMRGTGIRRTLARSRVLNRALPAVPSRPFIARDGRCVGDVERGEPSIRRNRHEPVAFFRGQPTQAFAFGAKDEAGTPAQVEIGDGSVAAVVQSVEPEAGFLQLLQGARQVNGAHQGDDFQCARSSLGQHAGVGRGMAFGDDQAGHAESRGAAQDCADIVWIGDLVEGEHQGIVAAAGENILELRLLQRSHKDCKPLMHGAGGQAVAEIVTGKQLDLVSQLGSVALGRLLGGHDALDPALGIGKGGEHGMAAENPRRLVSATGLPSRAGWSVAHGAPV